MNKRENLLSSMNPHTTTGALTDTEMLLVDVFEGGKRVLRSLLLPLDAHEPSGLLEYLWQAELNSVWVMPDTIWSRSVTCSWFEQVKSQWVVVVHPAPHQSDRPACALLWPKGSNPQADRRLIVVFPEHAGWNWKLPDTTSLLATVTYLEQLLARPVIDGPTLVAHQLLTELALNQSTSWFRSSPVDLDILRSADGTPIPLQAQSRDLVWMRPLTLVEQRQKYLHKYTHFSYHLDACIGVQLGGGTPQYSSRGRAYDGIHPGIWRVSAERAGSVFDGRRLPSCLDGEWMSTPQIQCCRDIGYQMQIGEGYFWPESQNGLKQWATTLWQAAERLHTHSHIYKHAIGRANASASIKKLAQTGLDILAREKAAGGWFRPDWWAHIIGRSRASLFAHLANLVKRGTMPVLFNGDAFWVVSNDPNPLTAVPGLLAVRRWSGYAASYEVPLPLSREVIEVFRTAEHADQAAKMLDTLANESPL